MLAGKQNQMKKKTILVIFHRVNGHDFEVGEKTRQRIEMRSCLTAENAPRSVEHDQHAWPWQLLSFFRVFALQQSAEFQYETVHSRCIDNLKIVNLK